MEQEIAQVYEELQTAQRGKLTLGLFDIQWARSPDRRMVYLATPIFDGGNYVPQSVRRAVGQAGLHAQGGGVGVALAIDEARFQVVLHYRTEEGVTNPDALGHIMDEFLALADEWHRLLDEYGEQDLIYVTH